MCRQHIYQTSRYLHFVYRKLFSIPSVCMEIKRIVLKIFKKGNCTYYENVIMFGSAFSRNSLSLDCRCVH